MERARMRNPSTMIFEVRDHPDGPSVITVEVDVPFVERAVIWDSPPDGIVRVGDTVRLHYVPVIAEAHVEVGGVYRYFADGVIEFTIPDRSLTSLTVWMTRKNLTTRITGLAGCYATETLDIEVPIQVLP